MSNKDKDTNAIPDGFEMVSDGTLVETHDFKREAVVMGRVLSMKTVQVRRGRNTEDNRVMTVDMGEKTTAVWESANLKDLFDSVAKGDDVYIKYTGDVDLNNGLNPMKQFVTGVSKASQPVG